MIKNTAQQRSPICVHILSALALIDGEAQVSFSIARAIFKIIPLDSFLLKITSSKKSGNLICTV